MMIKQGLIGSYINAGALLYAVFLTIVVSLISGVLITMSLLYRRQIEQQINYQLLVSNNQALCDIAMGDSTLSFPWDGSGYEISDNKNFNYSVEKRNWGAFDILDCSTSYNTQSVKKTYLVGRTHYEHEKTCLYLKAGQSALSIAGETWLDGNCYLPEGGIKPTYIEGNYYRNKELMSGDDYRSAQKLPTMNEEFIATIAQKLHGKGYENDSVMDIAEVGDKVVNSFEHKTLVLHCKKPTFFSNCSIIGNILVASAAPIEIFSHAKLDDIIIFAPKIIVRDGFSGSVQLYATDTLMIEGNCHLAFPSVAGVIAGDTSGIITLGEHSKIDGLLFLHANETNKKVLRQCRLEKNSEVEGLVYVQGDLQAKGMVYGTVAAHGFFLKTNTSYYVNHLYNVTFNAYEKGGYFSWPTFLSRAPYRQIKELN